VSTGASSRLALLDSGIQGGIQAFPLASGASRRKDGGYDRTSYHCLFLSEQKDTGCLTAAVMRAQGAASGEEGKGAVGEAVPEQQWSLGQERRTGRRSGAATATFSPALAAAGPSGVTRRLPPCDRSPSASAMAKSPALCPKRSGALWHRDSPRISWFPFVVSSGRRSAPFSPGARKRRHVSHTTGFEAFDTRRGVDRCHVSAERTARCTAAAVLVPDTSRREPRRSL